MRWLVQLISRLLSAAAEHPAISRVVVWGVGIIVALVIVRLIYGAMVGSSRRGSTVRARATLGTDWWARAQQLAAAGNYTEAAHALYLALLHANARRGHLTLHDSKTTGDYVRELRGRAAPPTLAAFTTFTRSYETVIYDLGTCDAERYGRLRDVAAPWIGVAA